MSFFPVLIRDLLILFIWDVIWLFLCHKIYRRYPQYFNYKKGFYKIRSWEQNGNFYIKFLKIKYWKDKLPQNMSKKGFLKNTFKKSSEVTYEYIEKFITETCIAEWYHLICIGFSVLLLFWNTSVFGIFLAILNLLGQFLYIAIQRYNRIRLMRFFKRKKIVHKV